MILKPRLFIFICLLLSLTIGLSDAQTYTLSPDGSHSNQNQINEALKNGNVYLSAGVYEVDNTIIIGSDRVLSGDSNAIIRVYSGSSQWFTGATGVISCSGIVDNVEICGFQIDGNIGSLPKSYANSRADTDHDCEKLIILRGSSTRFAKNIKIHNLKLYNSFSDGIYIIFGESVQCYDNFISNCQHEGIYYSCLKNSEFFRNKIAAICSDAGRLDNCVNCKVYDNYFFSYNGESYGQYKGGQAGLQIANAGSSHGYDASKKPQKTDNVEVYNNVFADPGRQAIWLHNYDGNVYVHDNKFIDTDELKTQGIPVGDISSNVSYDNPPSIETSENIFSSIFDFLNMKVYTQVGQNDTVILPEGTKNSSSEATGTIEYHSIGTETFTLIKIPSEELSGVSKVEYNINGKLASRTLMIGERSGLKVTFTSTDVWTGDFTHENGALKLNGSIPAEDIKITCVTPRGSFTPTMKTEQVNFVPLKVHPAMIVLFIALLLFIIFIKRSIKHMM